MARMSSSSSASLVGIVCFLALSGGTGQSNYQASGNDATRGVPYGQNIHRGAIDRIGRPSPRFRKRIGLEPMNLAAIDDVSAYSTNDGAAARSKTVPAGRDRHYVPHPLYR